MAFLLRSYWKRTLLPTFVPRYPSMSSSSHSPACLLQCIALQVQCACSANAMHMQRNASGCNAMQKKRSWRKGGDGFHIVVGCTGIVSLLRSQWRGEGREGGRNAQCILIISPLLSQCIPSVLHFSLGGGVVRRGRRTKSHCIRVVLVLCSYRIPIGGG